MRQSQERERERERERDSCLWRNSHDKKRKNIPSDISVSDHEG
jgi:hypothetical protein